MTFLRHEMLETTDTKSAQDIIPKIVNLSSEKDFEFF